jgi:hypothetical protein
MAKTKAPNAVVPESYLLIKDEHGFKVLHPQHGLCLLTNWDGDLISRIDFSDAIVGEHPQRGSVEVWGEGSSVEDAVYDLKEDGYTPAQIKKMKLRTEKVASI